MKKYIALCLIVFVLMVGIISYQPVYATKDDSGVVGSLIGQLQKLVAVLQKMLMNSNQPSPSPVPAPSPIKPINNFKLVPSYGKIGTEISIFSDGLTPEGNQVEFTCLTCAFYPAPKMIFEDVTSKDLKSLKFIVPEKITSGGGEVGTPSSRITPSGKYEIVVRNSKGRIVSPRGSDSLDFSSKNIFTVVESIVNSNQVMVGVVEPVDEYRKPAKEGCNFLFGNQTEGFSSNFAINPSNYSGQEVRAKIRPISGTAKCDGKFEVYELVKLSDAYAVTLMMPRGSSPDIKPAIGDFTLNNYGRSIKINVDRLNKIYNNTDPYEKEKGWSELYRRGANRDGSIGMPSTTYIRGIYKEINVEKGTYIFQAEDIFFTTG